MWLRNERIQRLGGGGFGEQFSVDLLSTINLLMMGAHKDRDTVQLIRRVRRERKSLLNAFECFNVLSFARSVNNLDGEMAEVGVYQGASARLLCEARGEKTLHLFDTFEGLPKASDEDRGIYDKKSGQYACSLESVSDYLKSHDRVRYYKGRFPDTAGPIEDLRFAFVHFDVDLYESTLSCLQFFYPRMTSGGIMLSHDYSLLAGVRQAFEEFFQDKPEQIMEMPTTQAMVVKR